MMATLCVLIVSACDDEEVTCPANQNLCDGVCCSGACEEGQCVLPCGYGQELCGEECVNLQNDHDHCGACANICYSDQVCWDGECLTECPEGLEDCDGDCANIQIDSTHCGDCETRCSADEICSGGACISCPDDLVRCYGICVDLQSDPDHCGDCDTSCADGEVCFNGTCPSECPDGFEDCDGSCVDTDVDVEHCGRCSNRCGDLEECHSGDCVLLSTADAFTSQGPGDSDIEAALLGTREIVLDTGDGGASNPFDTVFTVTFTPPSGNAVTVNGFYDGGDTWRARGYLTETGLWSWSTQSSDDSGLDGEVGSFNVVRSSLRGKLRRHPDHNQRWATEDGRYFLNLADTPYTLFNEEWEEDLFQRYVEDVVDRGISLMRVGYGGGYSVWGPDGRACDERYPRSNWIHDGTNYNRFDLGQVGTSDARLAWLLNNYPDVYVDLHLLPKTNDSGGRWYGDLNERQRERTMDHLLARLAGFPNVLFLIERDIVHSYHTWEPNLRMCREIGNYFADHDPWDTFRGCNEKSREYNAFTLASDFDDWESYLEVQSWGYPHGRAVEYYYRNIDHLPVHVFHGEDEYERPWFGFPESPAYYYRRLFWSDLLSGGSGAYGYYIKAIIPYDETGTTPYYYNDGGVVSTSQMTGLDEAIHIVEFFEDYQIDLADFIPDDSLARLEHDVEPEGDSGPSQVQSAHDGVNRYLFYHPNAADGEMASEDITDAGEIVEEFVQSRYHASLRSGRTPGIEANLTSSSGMRFSVTWFHPVTGESFEEEPVDGGSWVTLTAPVAFEGFDAVLYLRAQNPLAFIVAHRGGGDDAEGWGPENTMAVFRQCFVNGISIETDLNYTSDGVVILLHGGELSVTTDGSGAPTERTYDYIQGLDAAARNGWSSVYSPEPVPTFEQLLDEFALHASPGTVIIADTHRIDTPEMTEEMLTLIDEKGMFDRVRLQVYELSHAESLRSTATRLFGDAEMLNLAIWVSRDRELLADAVATGYIMEIHAHPDIVDEAADLPPEIRFIGGNDIWNVEGVDGISTDLVDEELERLAGNIPTAALAEPVDGSEHSPGSITLRAIAGDSDSSITRVEFYEGLNLLGTEYSPPYILVWDDVASGSYSLTVKVHDSGWFRTSEAVQITVE